MENRRRSAASLILTPEGPDRAAHPSCCTTPRARRFPHEAVAHLSPATPPPLQRHLQPRLRPQIRPCLRPRWRAWQRPPRPLPPPLRCRWPPECPAVPLRPRRVGRTPCTRDRWGVDVLGSRGERPYAASGRGGGCSGSSVNHRPGACNRPNHRCHLRRHRPRRRPPCHLPSWPQRLQLPRTRLYLGSRAGRGAPVHAEERRDRPSCHPLGCCRRGCGCAGRGAKVQPTGRRGSRRGPDASICRTLPSRLRPHRPRRPCPFPTAPPWPPGARSRSAPLARWSLVCTT